MGKFARTWDLMTASWRVLVQDKRLVVFPLIACAAMLVVIALFAMPIYTAAIADPRALERQLQGTPQMYLGLFVFYFLASLVVIFCNSALIACVLKRVDGERPGIGFGLAFAWSRLPQIIGWALLTSSVGMLLRMLEERVGFVGRIVIGLLGMAWSVTAFLVVPVLVAEGSGPIESYKRSVQMLKQTWGEQLIGNMGFGLLFALFGIVPSIVLFTLAIKAGPAAIVTVGALLVGYLILLGLVQATLQTIYQAAIYCYAATGEAPAGFDNRMVAGAFREKSRKGWL